MKIFKILGKVFLLFVTSIFLIVLFVFAFFNVAKFAIYSEYYQIETNVCENPGLNDNFVCQGIAVSEENDCILVSGYMSDKTNSRIYVTDFSSNSYYVKLTKNGKPYKGHVGGIATTKEKVFLCGSGCFYILSLDEILNSKKGDEIELVDYFEIEGSASFIFSNEECIIVGEFHDGGQYVTEHPYETGDGTYYAIMRQYNINDLTLERVYSIRNKVQGACLTPEGKIVLSTSYGLASSEYFVYDVDDAKKSDKFFEGAPVYYLEKYEKKVTGPAMGEDVDCYDGGIITMTESASNKYIFGKFFFANKIVKLKF